MIQRLSHSTFYVLDQEKAFDFYVNKLGFKVHTDATMPDGMRWLTVVAPGDPNHEINLMLPSTVMSEEFSKEMIKLLEAGKMGAGVFQTDDCWATYRDLVAKGVEFRGEPQDQFYGVEALMSDGCGNWFSVSQPKVH